MNYKMIGFVLGRIFLIEAGLLLFPLGVALIYGETALIPAFLIPIALTGLIGTAAGIRPPEDTAIFAREGFVIVALSWILMSAFGALPFFISGEIPDFLDAYFETVSGFTTTGSSILTDVEAMSQSLLFWRSFTHWVGGMGVLVFAMAILPMTDGRAMHLMRAEVPGPSVGKVSSKLRDSAKILYQIYFVMTVVEVVLLLAGGLPLFDSLICSFGSAGTGGFSNRALSVGAYGSSYAEIVIGVFMMLFGVNFNVYFLILIRRFREAFLSEELLAYLGIIAASTIAIAANISSMCSSVGESLRYAFFQVSSIITTTGFATTNFDAWPTFSKVILVLLMFFGACAGSTGGGLKISRVVILLKASLREIKNLLHPHAVTTVRFEGKPVDNRMLRGIHAYFAIYMILFSGSVLIVSLDGQDLISTFTAVASCFNNIGPGLGIAGPMGSFAPFSHLATFVLCVDMLLGRLELFPILVLLSPAVWKKRRRTKSHVPPEERRYGGSGR